VEPLRFQDGRFKIAQLTDTHFSGAAVDQRTLALIERVLDAEAPQLAVVTGDFVEGKEARDPAAVWRSSVLPFESRGLPWAAVFGNHDDEGVAGRRELLAAQQACAHCLSEPGPAELTGVGNYVLDVAGAAGVAARLYFFDSGSYAPAGAGDYAWIAHDQIAWYRARSRQLPGQTRPQALAFFHIPLPEYETAWNEGERFGSRHEDVFCPRLNSGLFASFHERGDVVGAFCGHDHLNDFEARLFGIRLCYGRATGYGGYGREDFPRGVRIIELRDGSPGFDSWLRLDGEDLRIERQAPARGVVLP
jgi:predicted phosphodiesterase